GLVEEVADAARADTYEHLYEFRARDREEGYARLSGDGLADQRFAGTGRAHQQHALGDPRPERGELVGELEELHDLRELLLRFLHTGDVGESDQGLVTGEHPGTAPPKAPRLVA